MADDYTLVVPHLWENLVESGIYSIYIQHIHNIYKIYTTIQHVPKYNTLVVAHLWENLIESGIYTKVEVIDQTILLVYRS